MFLPPTHVANNLVLQGADAEIELYELTPAFGTGTLHFKNDNDVVWLGTTYSGLPLVMSGEKQSVEGGGEDPRMTIGQPNLDLSQFKALIAAGSLDGAIVVRKTVLLDNIIGNHDIKVTRTYRVGVVQSYSRTQISLILRRFSGLKRVQIPFRQFVPPAFPYVVIG